MGAAHGALRRLPVFEPRKTGVKLLTRAFADAMDDRELTRSLSGAALLDSGAAAVIQERGHGPSFGHQSHHRGTIPAVEEFILTRGGRPGGSRQTDV